MNPTLALVSRWIGDWSGSTEKPGINMRASFEPVMENRGIMVEVEAFDAANGRIMRGTRIGLAAGPDGEVQCIGYSTEFGIFGLEETPDDDDVIALTGVTEASMQLNITYREEAKDTLLLSVFWRPHGTSLGKDAEPGLLARLHRRAAWKPGPPPKM